MLYLGVSVRSGKRTTNAFNKEFIVSKNSLTTAFSLFSYVFPKFLVYLFSVFLTNVVKIVSGTIVKFVGFGCVLHASLVVEILQYTMASTKDEDDRVLKDVVAPPRTKLSKGALFDGKGLPKMDVLADHLIKEGRLEQGAAFELIKQAGALFKLEPNLLELSYPVTGMMNHL